MTSLAVRLEEGDHIHLWMRPYRASTAAGSSVSLAGRTYDLRVDGPTRNPLPVTWRSPASGDAVIDWDQDATEMSVVYAFSPARVVEEGIEVLWASAATALDGERYGIRFRPPFGWMNDPNGLCEVDGVTHLFYQHNPHSRRWDTMHWGHAISRNGIQWVHQPIALLPREDLVRGAGQQGGAYSGTALPRADGTMRLFYTDRQDSRPLAREHQMTAVLHDGMAVGPSHLLLDTHPPIPGYRNDWRDPFVFEGPDRRMKMLLGGADASGSVVLLYETRDPEGAGGWEFVDVLISEPTLRSIPAECPCMIRLDGEGGGEDLWVLIYGLIGSRDEATQRRNLTCTSIGRFDGRHFEPIAHHELDFGTDCYAMQVWRGADGPRGIAWAANWTDVSADRDFESAMTLPRRLLWRDGRLATPPIAAVDDLRLGLPHPLQAGSSLSLLDGLAEITLEIEPGSPFVLALDHPNLTTTVSYDGEVVELHHPAPISPHKPSYRAPCPGLAAMRAFVDRGLVEVYVDGGLACCTKRIDSAKPFTAVSLSAGARIVSAQVWWLALPDRPSAARVISRSTGRPWRRRRRRSRRSTPGLPASR